LKGPARKLPTLLLTEVSTINLSEKQSPVWIKIDNT
jgi:hypothetical protein